MTASPEPIVVHRTLETAEDLFHELSPATGELWRVADYVDDVDSHLTQWCFRGQANDERGQRWDLRPSAHRRPDTLLPLPPTGKPIDEQTRRFFESARVSEFAAAIDDHGFVIPGDSHEYRDGRVRGADLELDPTKFPPPSQVAITGLAQHHGIPTRLLDWTRKPLVAAYFAAEEVARRRPPGKQPPDTECPYFSVFAVRRTAAEACETFDPELHFLTVPTATNANLYAQGGLFSLVQPLSDPGNEPLPAIDEVLLKHAIEIWEREKGRWRSRFPFLIEFRTPVREARVVMHTLRNMGVTAASIYPGLHGVAKAIVERRLCLWQKIGERS